MTDRLTLTRALESSGMQSAAAERIATEIYDAIHDNVATKTDLRELEARLDARFERLEHQITRMTNRLAGIVVVLLTLLFGALHLWPVK
jgi:flagellar capping protein FliD